MAVVKPRLCFVKKCRYNDTHPSKYHICGKCFEMGHGIAECNNTESILQLTQTYGDIELPLDIQCNISECKYPKRHTIFGHKCGICSSFGHGMTNCTLANTYVQQIPKEKNCPMCKANMMYKDLIKCYRIMTQCPICMTDKDNILMSPCGHPMCTECALKYFDTFDIGMKEISSIPDRELREDIIKKFADYDIHNQPDKPVFTYFKSYGGCKYYVRRIQRDAPIHYVKHKKGDYHDITRVAYFINGLALI